MICCLLLVISEATAVCNEFIDFYTKENLINKRNTKKH